MHKNGQMEVKSANNERKGEGEISDADAVW